MKIKNLIINFKKLTKKRKNTFKLQMIKSIYKILFFEKGNLN